MVLGLVLLVVFAFLTNMACVRFLDVSVNGDDNV